MNFKEFWNSVMDFLKPAWDFIQEPLFSIGDGPVSLGTILYIIFGVILLIVLSKRIKNILVHKIFQRAGMDPGVGKSVGNLARFFLVIFGIVLIIQSAGINLSALTVLFGALGVGIGFGLQTITDNFISGIIIVFERPIKVGDRIELDDVNGKVTNISIRATTVLTNDNVAIIVPNSEFISGRVINWSHNDRSIRFRIPVGVSYNEDPQKIKRLLLEVADKDEDVLKDPAPLVFFDEFGDSSLNFKLAVWTATSIDRVSPFKSDLYYAIFEKFKEHNVEVPFPQRDLHLRSSSIDIGK